MQTRWLLSLETKEGPLLYFARYKDTFALTPDANHATSFGSYQEAIDYHEGLFLRNRASDLISRLQIVERIFHEIH
jgi:hypothetical protein